MLLCCIFKALLIVELITSIFCVPQEVCQSVEQLKPRLMALGSATKRLGEGSQLEEEVANLQRQQGELMEKAAETQSTLESLLALWQRYYIY